MRVSVNIDEMWPVIFIRPKEQALQKEDLMEIPQILIDRYKAVEEEFIAVQKLLKEYL